MQKQSGFTLIEIVLVLAISSLLFMIAFVGQHQLQAQARFDAAINKVIQDIAYTRNYAGSEVNEGCNTVCKPSQVAATGDHPYDQVLGASYEFGNYHHAETPPAPLTELETFYIHHRPPGGWCHGAVQVTIDVNSAGCGLTDMSGNLVESQEQYFTLPVDLSITAMTLMNPTTGSLDYTVPVVATYGSGVNIFYVNTGQAVQTCFAQQGTSVDQSVDQDGCNLTGNPYAKDILGVTLTDNDGHSASLSVDPVTGIARRL